MTVRTADIVDLLAGIAPGDALDGVRDRRTQARVNAQRSFEALLEPTAPGSFPLGERYAIAAFVAQLHTFHAAVDFYRDLLADEDPELADVLAQAGDAAVTAGPYGGYREAGLQAESVPGTRWAADAWADALGPRLQAALQHAHLLVLHPRDARAGCLQRLVDAGWSADDIVSLSQLVAFLTFQLRLAWGLRVLAAAAPAAADVTKNREV